MEKIENRYNKIIDECHGVISRIEDKTFFIQSNRPSDAPNAIPAYKGLIEGEETELEEKLSSLKRRLIKLEVTIVN